MRLSQALSAMGWRLVVTKHPNRHKDRIGGYANRHVRALSGGRIAVTSDSWEHAYSVSHEMAETMHSFNHSELMFTNQANILAGWHAMRDGKETKFTRLICRSYRPVL